MKNKAFLVQVKQHEGVSLNKKVNCFNKVKNLVMDCTDDNTYMAACRCICPESQFSYPIQKRPPTTFAEFLTRVSNDVNAEELDVIKPLNFVSE